MKKNRLYEWFFKKAVQEREFRAVRWAVWVASDGKRYRPGIALPPAIEASSSPASASPPSQEPQRGRA